MLIDAHAQLDRHGADSAPVLEELRHRRAFTIAASTDPESFERTRALGSGEPLVLPALGVHPEQAPAWAARLDEVDSLLDEAAIVGEIGLDHVRGGDAAGRSAQEAVFGHLLRAAVARDLVVGLHTKAAEEKIAAALRSERVRRAIVHRYAGPVRAFRQLVEVGALFSVGVDILKDEVARAIAAEVPEDRLLTATDNPCGWRRLTGEEGRPALLIEVQRELARVRGMTVGDVQDLVRTNLERLIAGDDRLEEPYRRAGASF